MYAKQNILIVDDNSQLNTMLKTILESENFRIFQAYNGREAFKLAMKENIDLIIMDLLMPQMNGDAAIEAIYLVNPKIKYIVISGNMNWIDKEKLKKLNVVEFFDKPFDIPVLIESIKKVLLD